MIFIIDVFTEHIREVWASAHTTYDRSYGAEFKVAAKPDLSLRPNMQSDK